LELVGGHWIDSSVFGVAGREHPTSNEPSPQPISRRAGRGSKNKIE
jgi:hypothetical protein